MAMALALNAALRCAFAVAGVIALATILTTTPANAQSGAKARPADLNAYSLRYWPRRFWEANTPNSGSLSRRIARRKPRRYSRIPPWRT